MSQMTRRGLLAVLAGAVLDPERLVWVPGRKLISIPAPRPIDNLAYLRWRDYIIHEALRILHNKDLVLALATNTELQLSRFELEIFSTFVSATRTMRSGGFSGHRDHQARARCA